MSEAVLLVGGRGTRLRPLTLDTPKPLLPVAGAPLIAHQLARARDAGVDHVVLATSHRADVFADVFGDGAELGIELEYVREDEPLGTGGAIRNAADRLRSTPAEPVLILNGDILSGHDLAAQVAAHLAADADVTLHLVEVDDARPYGCVPTDDAGRVSAFLEKMPEPVSRQINAGCYVFRRAVVDQIPPARVVSVERETFPALLAAGALVVGHVDNGYWLDLGTPLSFVAGSVALVRGVVASSVLPGPTGERLIVDGARVAGSASVLGGTVVGRGARIGDDAIVDGSVLLAGAVVETGACVRGSVIGAGARVGPGTMLVGVVVGDRADVGARNELLLGARVWPDAVLPDASVRFSSDEPS